MFCDYRSLARRSGKPLLSQIRTIVTSRTVRVCHRVYHITRFTLSVNGGGQGNQDIAMRKNTTATMIWNGIDWTAAGASSSTTLQAAYDNTLQSAGNTEMRC